MTSPPSGSEPSSAFYRLHERVQRWIWQQGWDALRDVQEAATHALLERREDVIIAAATASGKTEAAFLPICSSLVDDARGGVRAIYVGPLKALINDQFARLEQLCEALAIPVHRWHGDVAATRKRAVFEDPGGILLITPESLEALFVHRGTTLATLLARLDVVVVDELHAFIGAPRGRQLQSQLQRIEHLLGRRVPRVGLSATLGDMSIAAEYLRPGGGGDVVQITSSAAPQELRIQVRGYVVRAPSDAPTLATDDSDDEHDEEDEVAAHLYKMLRGANHLVFANSRQRVEALADSLRRACERDRVPNEFHPHHGGLSRELRFDAETMLKDGDRPITVISTSTLEMGIDIGSVKSVAQIDAPPSVAALRQRIGRSGRRGEPAVLRAYVEEEAIDARSSLGAELRAELVETAAKVDLVIQRWCEPPDDRALHLSTLVQQLLSVIAQHGGIRPAEAWKLLCERGPFRAVDARLFGDFLRALARSDLVAQEPDGTLLLGGRGERLVNHYSFYSAFETPEEYRVVHEGRPLGTITTVLQEETACYFIFAGRRWAVRSIDHERRVIDVTPARAGRTMISGLGSGFDAHDRVRERMLAIYEGQELPVYLDAGARKLLAEGRENFRRRALHRERVIREGEDVVVLPWRGTQVVRTIGHLLAARGLGVSSDGLLVAVHRTSFEAVADHLTSIARAAVPEPAELAARMHAPAVEKFDAYLTEDLRRRELQVRGVKVLGAHRAVCDIVAKIERTA
jgi:ATP-dependent Lhr-like helicase